MVSKLFSGQSLKPFKLYLDTMSQPCRALQIVFDINKVPYEPVIMQLERMEHLTDEFSQINPFKKVPVIEDNGFVLTESIAIFRYVSARYAIADSWYPKDFVKRAKVDEFLEWQHIGLRAPCALYCLAAFFYPKLFGRKPNPKQLESRKASMMKALDDMNDIWLANKPFVTGDTISFADILGACEVEHVRVTQYDPKIGRPKLAAWLDRVKAETNPHYDRAHSKIVNFANSHKVDDSKL